MRLSVVVPSYGRPEVLAHCLAALDAQERAPDEVLVVSRRGDDATQEVVTEHPAPLATKLVLVDTPGLVAAPNAGLEQAHGDVIAFTDDDARPHPDWLERIEQAFLADASLGGIGG